MRFGKIILYGVIVTLATIASLELLLRFGLGLGNPVLIQADLASNYIVKPDQNLYRFFSHVRVNHEGMRSDEIRSVKDPRALRVMFVGDSITYGTGRVDQKSIFTDIIRQKLPQVLNRPVEVLNASASGWAPDNEVAYIRSRGTFGSDLVILVLNGGDVTQPRALMSQAGDDLLQVRPPSAISELYLRYIGPQILHIRRKMDPGERAAPATGDIVRSNLADLDGLYAQLHASRTRFVILYLPIMADTPQSNAMALSVLQKWASKNAVQLLDFTPVERPYSMKQISIDGTHLNAFGNQIVAAALLKFWPT